MAISLISWVGPEVVFSQGPHKCTGLVKTPLADKIRPFGLRRSRVGSPTHFHTAPTCGKLHHSTNYKSKCTVSTFGLIVWLLLWF